MFADFESETEIKGISAWRFRANLNLINYTHPENLCFCPAFRKCAKPDATGQSWDLTGCEEPCLDGLLYASGCRGVPIVLSAPHFYNADPILESSVEGLKSAIDKHDTYLDIEPLTGVTLSAYKRGQVNNGYFCFGFDYDGTNPIRVSQPRSLSKKLLRFRSTFTSSPLIF